MNKFYKVSKEIFVRDAARLFPMVHEDFFHKAWFEIRCPRRATKNSAGYDFFLPFYAEIEPHGTVIIPTGIKAEMNPDVFLQMHIRSSVGIKQGVILSNCTGIIDADYFNNPDNEGHIMFALRNMSDKKVFLDSDSGIAQGIFLQYRIAEDDVAEADRLGGIGSTD